MTAQQIVSDPSELLILVDGDDREVGVLPKSDCHRGAGVLHRAFSIFLFNAKNELLLQRRSASKLLWPFYWSNSCCSHPRQGESMELATQRRTREELGVRCPLTFLYKFRYQAYYGDIGAEHELCSVYVGRYDDEFTPNHTEIAELGYFSPAEIDARLHSDPETFTPWFKLEWKSIRTDYNDVVDAWLASRAIHT